MSPNSLMAGGRITRKAAFLLVVGVLYLILGIAYALPGEPTPGKPDPYEAARFLVHLLYPEAPFDTLQPWGLAWAVVGVVGIVSAVRGRRDWQQDHIGYLVVEGWSLFWGVFAVGSTLFLASTRGWIVGLIFGVFGLLLHIVDGMGDGREEFYGHRSPGPGP